MSGNTPDMAGLEQVAAAPGLRAIHYGLVAAVAVAAGAAAALMPDALRPPVGVLLLATGLALGAWTVHAGYLYVLAATGALGTVGFVMPADYLDVGRDMLLLFWLYASGLYLFGRARGGSIRWYFPFPLTLSLYFLYAFCGLGVYIGRDLWWYNFPADMEVAGSAMVAGLVALIGGYGVWRVITVREPSQRPRASGWGWSRNHVRYALYATLLLGTVAAYFVFDRFRVIPLLATEVELARIYIQRTSPKPFWPLWNLLLQSGPLAFVLYRMEAQRYGARLHLLAAWGVSLVLLSLYGGRSLLFIPVILTLLVYVHEIRPNFSLARAGGFAAAILTFAMLFIGYRSQQEGYDLDRAFRFMIADFFPEVRTFALAAHELPDLTAGHEGLSTVIVGMIPSGLLRLVGVDKADLWQPIGTRVMEGLNFSGILGLRMSLVGELYFMGRWTTIAVVMGLMGLWLGWLDHRLRTAPDAVRRYPYIVGGLLTMLTIPYGTLYFVTIVWVLVPAFAISWFCRTSRRAGST